MQMWDLILSRLENELGKDTVEKWVRPLKLLRFDAANIYLEVDDSFQASWFEEHVRPLCQKLINNNGRPIQITLTHRSPNQTDKKTAVKESPFVIASDSLDPDMTLEHFLVRRPANEIAYKLIVEAAKCPFNPVLLYGPIGSGKTHLLMAAAAYLREKKLNAFYVNASTFTEHIVQAIRKGTMQAVRAKYRSADALLVDDIHVFARKSATQEEFFHTFNELHTRGTPIILSSNVPPSKLSEIEPRLVSRFEWGISVGLEKEDWTLILEKKANQWKLEVDPPLISFLVEKFPSSPLLALQALALRAKDVSRLGPHLASLLLKDLLEKEARAAWTPEKIVKAVASHHGIRSEDILGKSQTREATVPRQIAMYMCREKLKLPFQKIGELFGRDHSTVMSSVRQIQEELEKQKPGLSETIASLNRS
jgi:chromosomal replication initiator protein